MGRRGSFLWVGDRRWLLFHYWSAIYCLGSSTVRILFTTLTSIHSCRLRVIVLTSMASFFPWIPSLLLRLMRCLWFLVMAVLCRCLNPCRFDSLWLRWVGSIRICLWVALQFLNYLWVIYHCLLVVMLCFSLLLAHSFQYHRSLHDLRSLNLSLILTCFSLQTNRPYRSKPKVGLPMFLMPNFYYLSDQPIQGHKINHF